MYYLLFMLALVILFLCTSHTSRSTWAPFQSDQVKAICSHMTTKERRRAVGRAALFGLILGGAFGTIGLFGALIGGWLFGSAEAGGMVMVPAALIIMGILFWRLKPLIDQSQKEFLASTQWSKDQGITPEEIVLRKI